MAQTCCLTLPPSTGPQASLSSLKGEEMNVPGTQGPTSLWKMRAEWASPDTRGLATPLAAPFPFQ